MKILVVDDNIAIQEIIKDILIDEGHNIKIAGTIDEAVAKIIDFKPDAILVDRNINGEDGLIAINRVNEADPEIPLYVVLIKNPSEDTPNDNRFIMATITKPFKSTDISEALDIVNRKKNLTKETSKRDKIIPGFIGRIKRTEKKEKENIKEEKPKTENPITIITGNIENEVVSFGLSYAVFDDTDDGIYEFGSLFDPRSYSILVISCSNMKGVREKLKTERAEVITLTSKTKGAFVDISALGSLTVMVKEFIHQNNNPVIIFDDFTSIIDSNGINRSLLFIHQLINNKLEQKVVTYAISVDKNVLTVKDCNIILSEMKEYKAKSE